MQNSSFVACAPDCGAAPVSLGEEGQKRRGPRDRFESTKAEASLSVEIYVTPHETARGGVYHRSANGRQFAASLVKPCSSSVQ